MYQLCIGGKKVCLHNAYRVDYSKGFQCKVQGLSGSTCLICQVLGHCFLCKIHMFTLKCSYLVFWTAGRILRL